MTPTTKRTVKMMNGLERASARVAYARLRNREATKRHKERKRKLKEQLLLSSNIQENNVPKRSSQQTVNKTSQNRVEREHARLKRKKKRNLKGGVHSDLDCKLKSSLQMAVVKSTTQNKERENRRHETKKQMSKKRRRNGEEESLQNGLEKTKKINVNSKREERPVKNDIIQKSKKICQGNIEVKTKSITNGKKKIRKNKKKSEGQGPLKHTSNLNKDNKVKKIVGDITSIPQEPSAGKTKVKKSKKISQNDDLPVIDMTEFETVNDKEVQISEGEVETLSGEDIGAWCVTDSRQVGREAFQWMIAPHTEEEFFSIFWEKKPLFIQRGADTKYYKGIFSTKDLDTILKTDRVLFTKNLDITSYTDGKRETHNLVGQAHPTVVWDYYNNGCSVRMLNPQTFHPPVWKLLYNLQEYFNCFCGANVYLTPPDTQGFAPHWDDIEAFILQLEGKKQWKIYEPRREDEVLPVNSSKNLSQEELGSPVLEVTLQPGDLLYFPRGYIHQGHAVEGEHSLHITVSTYQCNTWGHYLEKLLPQALSTAMAEDVEFRKGLPKDYLDVMGIVNMDVESPSREAFISKVGEMVMRLLSYAPLDASADQRGASFMHDALPPPMTIDEKKCSARMGGERWSLKKQSVENRVELGPDTYIRLIRGNCIRVVAEEETVNLYHCLENTREYHEEEPHYLETSTEHAPAVEALVQAYPRYIAVENLPLTDEIEKINLASGLWERGLLVTATPLEDVDN